MAVIKKQALKGKLILATIGCVLLLMCSVALAAEDLYEDLWVRVGTTDGMVQFSGVWSDFRTPELYQGLEKVTNRRTTFVEFTFTGTAVRWISTAGTNRGIADVYLNGELVASDVDTYADQNDYQVAVYSNTDLPPGTHVLKIQPTGDSNPQASGFVLLGIDAFDYVPTLGGAIEIAEDVLAAAPIGMPAEVGTSLAMYYPANVADSLIAVITDAKALDEHDQAQISDTIRQLLTGARENTAALTQVVFPDVTGNGSDVVVTQGAPTWSEGKFGKGIAFHAGADLAEVFDFAVGDTHTIEFWVNLPFTTQAGWVQMFGFVGPATDRSPGIWKFHNQSQRLYIRYNPGDRGFSEAGFEGEGTDFPEDEWLHLALVKDGGNLDLYVNGEFVANTEVPESITPAERLLFGQRISMFDEIRIWETARTADEIKESFAQELTGSEAGLIAYWNFEIVQ